MPRFGSHFACCTCSASHTRMTRRQAAGSGCGLIMTSKILQITTTRRGVARRWVRLSREQIRLNTHASMEAKTYSYAEEKIVKIATLEDYAPFCITVGKFESDQIIPVGKDAVGFQGYSWDVLRESFQEMGYTIHLSPKLIGSFSWLERILGKE